MAVTHSVRPAAAVKRINPEHEREENLSRRHQERKELAEFLDAFEFDDAPGEDDARCLIAIAKF